MEKLARDSQENAQKSIWNYLKRIKAKENNMQFSVKGRYYNELDR